MAPFRAMTYPAFRPLVDTGSAKLFGVVSFIGGEAVGLGLGFERTKDESEALSLWIAPEYRRRGIGLSILKSMEELALARGCQKLVGCHSVDLSQQADAVARLLDRSAWSTSEPRMLICRANAKILSAPWMKTCRLTDGFSVRRWVEVTAEERAALEARRGDIPRTLFPIDWERAEYPLDSDCSLALYRNNELSGWLITHRLAPKAVRYSALYVNDSIQKLAIGVGLLAEGIHRQAAIIGMDSIGVWATPYKYNAMATFIRRRMRPFLESLRESRVSSKELTRCVTAAG